MLWEAWTLAKTYRCRPSELYSIKDEVTAWCFDRAVHLLGSNMDADLRNAEDGAKSKTQANGRRQRVMAKWLGEEAKYRDPAGASKPGAVSSEASGAVSL